MDKKPDKPGVKVRSQRSIQIEFEYKGVRRRETVNLPPTPPNLARVERMKAAIKHDIAVGTFDYLKWFPDSKRARHLSPQPAQGMTVGALLDEWLLNFPVGTVEIETERDYREYIAGTWKPELGALLLFNLNAGVVQNWVDSQKKRGQHRIRNLLIPLSHAMGYAVRKSYIAMNPVKGIKVKRVRGVGGKKVIDPFTQTELNAIVKQLEPAVANMVEFCAWTGLRLGELFSLRWTDYNEKRGTVSIERSSASGRIKATKTESSVREVTLLAPALAALNRQKAHTRLLHREIFLNPGHRYAHAGPAGAVLGDFKPSTVNRKWGDEKALRRRWVKACKAAGVRYRFPRQLRHTFASWMLNGGEAPIWVQEQMGHKHLSETLDTYTKFIDNMHPNGGMKAVAAYRIEMARLAKVTPSNTPPEY